MIGTLPCPDFTVKLYCFCNSLHSQLIKVCMIFNLPIPMVEYVLEIILLILEPAEILPECYKNIL